MREVLERFRRASIARASIARASIARSADAMSRLYAADAVHEFPFTPPGVPSRLEGRAEIVTWMAEGWKAYPLAYERYRTLAVHDTGDPETIVVEQEAIGTSPSTGAFALPDIVVLTVRDGRIVRLRDYADVLAVSVALGGAL